MLIRWRVGAREGGFGNRGFRGSGLRGRGLSGWRLSGRRRGLLPRHSSQGDDGSIAPIFNAADPVPRMIMRKVRSPMPVVSAILIVMVTVAERPSKEPKAENHVCFRLRLGEECQAQNTKAKNEKSLHPCILDDDNSWAYSDETKHSHRSDQLMNLALIGSPR